jgi:hypothetical protein
MKPNKDFRLSKSTKRILATFIDPHKRGEWKRLMISAEIAEKQAKMAKLTFNKSNQGDE